MTGATLFSGIHSAELAMPWVDWKWCADIEEFPSAVGSYRHPHIPNLGDVTHADFIDRAKQYGPVELLVFGSPCQSFSVAGRRLGLDDPRGNLALYALGIVAQLRPRWWLFENVPGLLSTDGGTAFASFLGEVEKLGYSCAWRVLDAAFFGVPQRRRRLFVVACAGDWRASAAVFFERESVSRRHSTRRAKGTRTTNPANASARLRSFWEQLVAAFGEGEESDPARSTGQVCEPLAPTLPGRSKRSGQLGSDFEYDGGLIGTDLRNGAMTGDTAHTLQTKPNGGQSLNSTPTVIVPQHYAAQAHGEYAAGSVASPAKSRDHKGGTVDLVLADPISAHEQRTYSHEGKNNFRLRNVVPVAAPLGNRMRGLDDACADNLQVAPVAFDTYNHSVTGGAMPAIFQPIAFSEHGGKADSTNCSDLAYTLRNPGKGGRTDSRMVAAPHKATRPEAETALPAIDGVRGGNETQLSYGHRSAFAVRRLTAIEAGRLQGFPDLWAHIPWQCRRIDAATARYYSSHGVKVWQEGNQWYTDAPCDGPLYRAFGNAMAIPVIQWLGDRIRRVDELMQREG